MKTNKTPHPCIAHVAEGDSQAVATELHVLIMRSIDGGFVAQGIEIDYVATGESEEQVRDHFASGFTETILSYLRRGRDLAGLFKSATPAQYRHAYFASETQDVLRCAVRFQGNEIPAAAPIPEYLSFRRSHKLLA